MTFAAIDLAVAAEQRESRFVVVESNLPERRFRTVTFIAGRTQLPVMRILVAGGTTEIF